jgi:hypothetical protein
MDGWRRAKHEDPNENLLESASAVAAVRSETGDRRRTALPSRSAHGGGTTTLELTALRRPFIYFPLEGHFDQRIHVASRIERHRAGVRLEFSETTPEHLASMVLANLGAEVDYPPIALNGAQTVTPYRKRI